jgi:hypothetical protein
VEDVSLEDFAHGRGIRVRHDPPRFDRGHVVERARSRLGERNYRILTNNCEHFCTWALRGESRSLQIDVLHAAARIACRAIRDAFSRTIIAIRRYRPTPSVSPARPCRLV